MSRLASEVVPGWAWPLQLYSLAAASAVAVAVVYLPQALLASMAADLGVANGTAGVIPTAVQIGYAVGIFLLVPLADKFAPHKQVTVQALLLVLALLITAVAPSVGAAAAGFAVVGIVANIAQVIISVSGRLAPEGKAGATVATIVGSLTIGIFGGRILAGLLVAEMSWRWVLVVFAALVLLVLIPCRSALKQVPAPSGSSYGRLLLATVNSARTSRITAQAVATQFFVFATFNSLWSVVVLHLTGPGHGLSARSAGLFGIIGLAAGLAGPILYRRLGTLTPVRIVGVFLAVFVVSFVSLIFDADALPAFAVSAFFATLAQQFIQTANQRRVLVDNSSHPAPANALYMVGAFLGGAVGSFTGVLSYGAGGMPLVGAQGVFLLLCAALIWLLSARSTKADRNHRSATLEPQPENGAV